ncbi:unnamed protein product [Aphanomyces euteiches]
MTCFRVWKRGQASMQDHGALDVRARGKGNAGRKPKRTQEEVEQAIKGTELWQRQIEHCLKRQESPLLFCGATLQPNGSRREQATQDHCLVINTRKIVSTTARGT